MKLTSRIEQLRLRHTFTISRGSEDVAPVVIAELEGAGQMGTGEASPSKFYGEDAESVRESLGGLSALLAASNPLHFHHLLEEAAELLGPHRAALSALDLAVHDLAGRLLGQPLHRLLG
jgi:L-alanine-DL-glutamate epimerase-like enolase superfamily enzyme